MGKFEQEASRKVLAGEHIHIKTKYTFLDAILIPFRMLKNWNRQREIRKNIWGKP